MLNLEEQADNAKARELYWKPMGWLGAIRPTTIISVTVTARLSIGNNILIIY
jgi:hypothetical protein